MSKDSLWAMYPGSYIVTVLGDDVTTVAEVVVAEGPRMGAFVLGRGVARRRKGDRRDPAIGETLALQRAFEQAAEELKRQAEMRLSF